MAMVIDNKFDLGQRVYLSTDQQQYEGIVTQLVVTEAGIIYSVSFAGDMHNVYHFELTTEKDYSKVTE